MCILLFIWLQSHHKLNIQLHSCTSAKTMLLLIRRNESPHLASSRCSCNSIMTGMTVEIMVYSSPLISGLKAKVDLECFQATSIQRWPGWFFLLLMSAVILTLRTPCKYEPILAFMSIKTLSISRDSAILPGTM